MSPSRFWLTLLCALLATLGALGAEELGSEKIYGFDLAGVAEATCRLTSFRTQFGEAQMNDKFDEWLSQRGQTRGAYDRAYAAYYERFRNDRSGRLEARFHTLVAEYTRRFEMGDMPDRSQEKRGGLTLDRYAEIAVALTRPPGQDITAGLKKFGMTMAQWQQANDAWTQAMRDDTTYSLVQQYGLLYQKHAGPAFAQEQEALLAAKLAGRFEEEPPAAEPRPAPETTAELRAALQSADRDQRWEAARPLAHQCSLLALLGNKAAADPRAPDCTPAVLRQELLPVVLEMIDRHGDSDLHYATGMLGFIEDFGWQKDAELTLLRAVNRWKDHLQDLEAAFAPIQNKATSERIPLRTKIDEHHAAIDEVERQLAQWAAQATNKKGKKGR